MNPVSLIMDSDKSVSASFIGTPVSSVRIDGCPTRILVTGDQHPLSAIISPAGAFDQSVRWSSSNNGVANVDENGVVTALSQGTATITVTTNDGGYKHTCNVGIMSSGIPVTGVSISNCPSFALRVDSTWQLWADVAPVNAGDLRVSWSSSNEAIATVTASGLVRAISEGEATIRVTSNLGGLTNECTVFVDVETNINPIGRRPQSVEIYPNPVSGILNFKFPDSVSERRINFYNIQGQLLYSKATRDDQAAMDVRKFSKEGLLLVKVVTADGVVSQKIAVIR